MNPALGQMILRIVLGVIFVAHGAAKMFGDGGPGAAAGFLGSLGVPVPILASWVVTLLEFVGGMFLIVGVFVLPAAILLAIHMLLGIILFHAQSGFFVIGPGAGGVEFNLLLIAGLLSMLLGGPGLAAVDNRSAPPAAREPRPRPKPMPEPEPEPAPEASEPEAAFEPEPEPTPGASEPTPGAETATGEGIGGGPEEKRFGG